MKKELDRLIQSTMEPFLSAINDRSRYYDLILSLIAWKALSAASTTVEGQPDKRLTVPGPDHQFDLVMQYLGVAGHQAMVSQGLSAWETANPKNLAGLLVPDRDLIKDIPETLWEHICLSWSRFLALYGPSQAELAVLLLHLMDQLELSLSEDRLTFGNYAPKELVSLMVHLIDDGQSNSLYDPYCWSGGFLSAAVQALPGLQDVQGFTATGLPWKLAKLRLLILPQPAEIRVEPGFNHYTLPEERRFDRILMNPPYGRGEPRYFLPGEQGPWTDLAYASGRVDLALVCHSLNRLSYEGAAAIILPGIFLSGQGVLQEFRSRIIRDNLLDAVITLPAGVFPQTGVSTTILCFHKKKQNQQVLMLDASSLVKKTKSRVFLNETVIADYISTYREKKWQPDDHFTVVTNDEIRANNFDLKFSSYGRTEQRLVNPFPPSSTLLEDCARLSAAWKLTEQKINQLIKEKEKTTPNTSPHGPDKN